MSSRRRIARKMERKKLIEKLATKCPFCRKTAANSEEEAWELARKQFARNGGEMPKRVYECRRGSGIYHWTRQEQAKRPDISAEVGIVLPSAELPIYDEEYWK